MNNELEPCPFNIGDKITINNPNYVFPEFGVKIVTGIYFEYPDKYVVVWCDYIDEKGQTRGGGEDYIDYVKLHERRPLCPDTIEASANEKWQWWGGSDEEYYETGPYDSRDEAIEIIVDEGDYDEGFHIIEAVKHSLKFDARELIKYQYFEKEDYFSRDRYDPSRKGDHVAADKELQKLLDDWVIKHQSTFVKPDIFSNTRNAEFIDAQAIRRLKGEA